MKENLLADVNAEFDKMIEYGALVELSDDVMRSWNGPAHWVSLQPVLNLTLKLHRLDLLPTLASQTGMGILSIVS